MFKRFQSKSHRKDETNVKSSVDPIPGDPVLTRTTSAQDQRTRPPLVSDGSRKPSSGSTSEWLQRLHSASSATGSDRRRSSSRTQVAGFKDFANNRWNVPAHGLGLHLIHDPTATPRADVIFVHGLGGHSLRTWSWNHDPDCFWPGLWLPADAMMSQSRIFIYGYNANYKGGGRSVSTITDFAKDLLYSMHVHKQEGGLSSNVGKYPLIFVAHSMGGLVVKKAYILASQDVKYQQLAHSTRCIVFLSTPHRGTQLATILQNVLSVSLQSSKDFIADLVRNSSAIEELNETFRHFAGRLIIYSFYETQETSLVGAKVMILEKESSILGYASEHSVKMDADHHNVCKFRSQTDPDYIKLLYALQTMLADVTNGKLDNKDAQKQSEKQSVLRKRLRIGADPENDLRNLQSKRLKATCTWIDQDLSTLLSADGQSTSSMIWFTAPPASGKSVLSSHVIDELQTQGCDPRFFFFRCGDSNRRSVADMLRWLAYQTACADPVFCEELMSILDTDTSLDKSDATNTWRKIFESSPSIQRSRTKPLFWVVDAVDEAEPACALFDFLGIASDSSIPLRLFVTGRRTEQLYRSFNRLSVKMSTRMIDKHGSTFNNHDIHIYAEAELKLMQGTIDSKSRVLSTIVSSANSSFLWVKLVLDEIGHCDTEKQVRETLAKMPRDMESMYKRMEDSIIANRDEHGLKITKALLEWTMFSPYRMSLLELEQALKEEHEELIDMRNTIRNACGQFIVIDDEERITILHQTAREYLSGTSTSCIAIPQVQTHEKLFSRCVSCLSNPEIRKILMQNVVTVSSAKPFLFHAARAWMHHLQALDVIPDEILDKLVKFFSDTCVLSWIYMLAAQDRMHYIVWTAKALLATVSKVRKMYNEINPMLHRLSDLETLENWAADLTKVVGKFNRQLRASPKAVYEALPALCPSSSDIYKRFHRNLNTRVVVSPPDPKWNENLARLALPGGLDPQDVVCAGPYIAVSARNGTIYVWTAIDFKEVCQVEGGESLTAMSFNGRGDKLAAYGLTRTKVWAIPSGSLLDCVDNPHGSRAMSIIFFDDEKKLMIACNDRVIQQYSFGASELGWQDIDARLLREDYEAHGTFASSPNCLAFSRDGSHIVVGYRGFPMSVWSIDEGVVVSRCMREVDPSQLGSESRNWFAVDKCTWNSATGHVIAIFVDGAICKWHPYTGEYEEVKSKADEVTCSIDGKLFATSSAEGTIRVWHFEHFSPIYHLASYDLANALVFNPDRTRLYDIRGSVVNAWEPNNLLRLSESWEATSGIVSENQQSTVICSEATAADSEPISCLSIAPSSKFYCIGDEEGLLRLTDLTSKPPTSVECIAFHNFLGVHQIAWADKTPCFAAADLSGEVVLYRVGTRGGLKSKEVILDEAKPRPKFKFEGQSIHQIVLSSDGTNLVAVCDQLLLLWNVSSSCLSISKDVTHASSRSWMQHPQKSDTFLSFGSHDVSTYSWRTLDEICCVPYAESASVASSSLQTENTNAIATVPVAESSDGSTRIRQKGSFIRKARATFNRKYVLLQRQQYTFQGSIEKKTMVLHVDALSVASQESMLVQGSAKSTTNSITLPKHVDEAIEVPLDILPDSRLVFLDRDLWICSYQVNQPQSTQNVIKRHAFLPRDWTSTEGLEQCCVTAGGMFLAPRGSEVVTLQGKYGSLFDT